MHKVLLEPHKIGYLFYTGIHNTTIEGNRQWSPGRVAQMTKIIEISFYLILDSRNFLE
jgi:hypothetical protein